MDNDDFKDWQICWRANLWFHSLVKNPKKCIVCSEIASYAPGTRRSTFWLDATRCSAGHRQATSAETQATPGLGVCATCDTMYMFDVIHGKRICRREGCRRAVRIHEAAINEKLASDEMLLT